MQPKMDCTIIQPKDTMKYLSLIILLSLSLVSCQRFRETFSTSDKIYIKNNESAGGIISNLKAQGYKIHSVEEWDHNENMLVVFFDFPEKQD